MSSPAGRPPLKRTSLVKALNASIGSWFFKSNSASRIKPTEGGSNDSASFGSQRDELLIKRDLLGCGYSAPFLSRCPKWSSPWAIRGSVSTKWETVKKAIDPRDLEQLAKVYVLRQMLSGDFPITNRMTPKVHTRKA